MLSFCFSQAEQLLSTTIYDVEGGMFQPGPIESMNFKSPEHILIFVFPSASVPPRPEHKRTREAAPPRGLSYQEYEGEEPQSVGGGWDKNSNSEKSKRISHPDQS